MGKENSLLGHMENMHYYKVDVYEYPSYWENNILGRLRLRLAYKHPTPSRKVYSGAAMSMDRETAQMQLQRVVSQNYIKRENFKCFGKVVEDRGL